MQTVLNVHPTTDWMRRNQTELFKLFWFGSNIELYFYNLSVCGICQSMSANEIGINYSKKAILLAFPSLSLKGIKCFNPMFVTIFNSSYPTYVSGLYEIGDFSCITSCLLLTDFLMYILLSQLRQNFYEIMTYFLWDNVNTVNRD